MVLNVSRDGASTTSLGNPFQCFTTLIVKNFFLLSSLNLPCFSLKPLPLVLSLLSLLKRLSPFFLLSVVAWVEAKSIDFLTYHFCEDFLTLFLLLEVTAGEGCAPVPDCLPSFNLLFSRAGTLGQVFTLNLQLLAFKTEKPAMKSMNSVRTNSG